MHRHLPIPTASILGLTAVLAACAGPQAEGPYRVSVLDQPVATDAHAPITVSVTNTATGRPVDGAAISDGRLFMRMPRVGPPGKTWRPDRSHREDVDFVGPAGSGQYRLVGDVSMPGTWSLDLAVKAPGEPAAARRSAKFVAVRERQDP